MTSTRLRTTLLALLLSFGLLAAACGDDDNATSSDDAPTTTEAMDDGMDDAMTDDMDEGMTDDMMMDGAVFGEACALVPDDGDGSFDGMAQDPVATAASNNPVLSTLVTAVGEAGLVDTLNSGGPWTVFAPANPAFEAIPEEDLEAVLADTDLLTSILTYHVVEGQIAPEDLAGTLTTVNGETLEVEGSGESFTVNGANVICGNVQTANATVYIIDAVLMP
ncbi:MAG: fasciclin domain-containing protein [Acidimicrobiales bacterium]